MTRSVSRPGRDSAADATGSISASGDDAALAPTSSSGTWPVGSEGSTLSNSDSWSTSAFRRALRPPLTPYRPPDDGPWTGLLGSQAKSSAPGSWLRRTGEPFGRSPTSSRVARLDATVGDGDRGPSEATTWATGSSLNKSRPQRPSAAVEVVENPQAAVPLDGRVAEPAPTPPSPYLPANLLARLESEGCVVLRLCLRATRPAVVPGSNRRLAGNRRCRLPLRPLLHRPGPPSSGGSGGVRSSAARVAATRSRTHITVYPSVPW